MVSTRKKLLGATRKFQPFCSPAGFGLYRNNLLRFLSAMPCLPSLLPPLFFSSLSSAPANAKQTRRYLRGVLFLLTTSNRAEPLSVMPSATPSASIAWQTRPLTSSPPSGQWDLLDPVVGQFYNLCADSAARKTSTQTPSRCKHTSALAESPNHPRDRLGLINWFVTRSVQLHAYCRFLRPAALSRRILLEYIMLLIS